jgi:hypothetical protein
MTIHVLVEGSSERAFFELWSPRAFRGHHVKVHPHQGKGELPKDLHATPEPSRRGVLDQLPGKLRGFANSLDPRIDRVVVLVDADDDDPLELIAKINEAVRVLSPALQVLVQLAIEETEAFYLGDLRALELAFPKADLKAARNYTPDSICGTWELFGKIVADGGANKVAWAEAMGPVLTTKAASSRSPSFKALVRGLSAFVAASPDSPEKPTSYRHPRRNRSDSGRRR